MYGSISVLITFTNKTLSLSLKIIYLPLFRIKNVASLDSNVVDICKYKYPHSQYTHSHSNDHIICISTMITVLAVNEKSQLHLRF